MLQNVYHLFIVITFTADDLTVAEIVGIVLGIFFFFAFITSMIAFCLCCFIPTCPCYYRRRSYYSVRTVLVEQPQVVTTTQTVAPPPPYGSKPVAYSTFPQPGYQAVPPPQNY